MLPDDVSDALLVGRMALTEGPTPVAVRNGRVEDLSAIAPTVSELFETVPPGTGLPKGRDIGALADFDLRPVWETQRPPVLLAPVDLQCVKASGVTFAVSALERVIEERARGDMAEAKKLRAEIRSRIGEDISTVRPGSAAAERLKKMLIEAGLWSQYLEVAIGPDAEIFTKCTPLSAVGSGDYAGIRSDSSWNNPEPEVVLISDSKGQVHGATLGNDVNLRDFEGRSALLLGKAKDNNASCAIGPFIRLFDAGFTIDDVRQMDISLQVTGDDGYVLKGSSNMRLISRDPLDLIGQSIGANHQYPDGFALFLGTMFAPIDDRDVAGGGFTHKVGDVVQVSAARLGVLTNKVAHSDQAPPWTLGITALMRNLAARNLLRGQP